MNTLKFKIFTQPHKNKFDIYTKRININKMPSTVLFIGDPHIQVSNAPEVNMFIERITKLAQEKKPDLIVIAGDLLHTHERLHTLALNKAYELVNNMRDVSKTYILVGNHDLINNQQFLTNNHWMNGMKDWDNVVIVDTVLTETINEEKFLFVPYVPPGRFVEALNTLDEKWENVSCIFAHQEFSGCKMGAIISVEGDKWSLTNPYVISGHIHSRQIPQENVYYTGSAMQHAFGESEKNIIAYLTFNKTDKYQLDEINLDLPRKKIVYLDVESISDYTPPETDDKIKVTVSGGYEEFKALKKTKKYKKLVEKGVKITFKAKKIERAKLQQEHETNLEFGGTDFKAILSTMVNDQKNPYLSQAFELVVHNKKMDSKDIMFLD
jgi:DNA repair exonuclease SbcCD nuclease subunit